MLQLYYNFDEWFSICEAVRWIASHCIISLLTLLVLISHNSLSVLRVSFSAMLFLFRFVTKGRLCEGGKSKVEVGEPGSWSIHRESDGC